MANIEIKNPDLKLSNQDFLCYNYHYVKWFIFYKYELF